MSGGPDSELAPGTRLGDYEIKKKLGAGGMGVVYLATDTKLRRQAAIKVLADGEESDATAPRRLVLEAQSASALNHPNIVTVYQAGSEAGTDFIAMEYVAGHNLHALIPKSGMAPLEALKLAIPIAAALAAAHEAGIVHRDLKPGNVMVTDRGTVKVVDFGLAKRSKAVAEAGDTTDTMPGVVRGTFGFMAPEQIQGREVDGRCDIWAFGCLLYRMLTGKDAFDAGSAADTMAAVLIREPAPLREMVPGVPPAFERTVARCLRKNPAERWQSMVDVSLVLEDLAAEAANPQAPVARRRGVGRAALALALLAGGALGAGAFWWNGRRAPGAAPESLLRMATLDAGLSGWPALSKDGSLMAYASDRAGDGNLDIWLKQVGGRQAIRLTQDPADESAPSISPDGTKVAFRSERNGGGIYVVPALGGEAMLIAPEGRNPKFSPDGRQVAFWTGRAAGYLQGSAKVFIVDAGGGTPQQIAAGMAAALYPAWSPKGDALLALARDDATRAPETGLDWWILPIRGAPPRKTGMVPQLWASRLLARRTPAPAPLDWQDPDGRVTFALEVGDAWNLWQTTIGTDGRLSGFPRRVTLGPGRQREASWAQVKGGERLAFADTPLNYDIWQLPVDAESGAVKGELAQLVQSPAMESSPSLSEDGSRLTFLSKATSLWALRSRDEGRGGVRETTLLTSDRYIANQVLSGDGRRVFYSTGAGDILAQPAPGGVAEELCKGCGTVTAASRDGAKVLYEPYQGEDLTYWDAASRRSVKAALRPAATAVLSGARFSPDGRWIAFEEIDNRNATARVWIARAEGPLPVPRTEWIAVTDGSSVERDPAWSPGGSLLYFLSERDGFRCIWARRLDRSMQPAGPAFAVKHLHAARLSLMNVGTASHQIGFWAAPGRLVFSLGELTGNIWLEETAAQPR